MRKRFLVPAAVTLLLPGCGESGPTDYFKITGGGLTFNYRYAQATMVVVAKQLAPLPENGMLEAVFDHPGYPKRDRVTRPVLAGKLLYKLESSYLKGIEKGVPLTVTVRLLDASGQELDRDERQYVSDVNQSELPSEPLVAPDKPNYVPLPETP
jgi:hypothetical protein